MALSKQVVLDSATSILLTSADPNRVGLRIYNKSSAPMLVSHNRAALPISAFVRIEPFTSWVMPDPVLTGDLYGVWLTNGDGQAECYISTTDGGQTYTDEQARDVIGATIVGGTNVTVTPNDGADTITIAATTGYTDEQVRDVIAAALVGGTNITVVPNDGADTITLNGYTDEQVRDVIGATLTGGSNITITPNDGADTITITATSPTVYTDEQARDAVGAALTGVTDQTTVTVSDVGDTISLGLSSTFLGRMSALEGARSLIQCKDNLSGSGAAYVDQPGTAGNYTSCGHSAGLDVSGDIEWVMRVALPVWKPTVTEVLCSKFLTATANRSWEVRINLTTGFPSVVESTDGTATTTATSSVAPTVADGAWLWMKITRIASNSRHDFYTAPDTGSNSILPSTWTDLSLNRTTAATGALFASAGGIEIGGAAGGTANMAPGKFGRMLYKSGIGGTTVADFNPSDWTTGTSWVGPVGNTWTLNGTATVLAAGVSNNNTEFALSTTDAFSNALAIHDGLYFRTNYTFINTSGASVNYTQRALLNGAVLFTCPAIVVPTTAAGQVYTGATGIYVDMSATDGSKQIAIMETAVAAAVTGTDTGSSVCAVDLAGGRFTGNRAASVSTFTTIPTIQLMLTMGALSPLVQARSLLTTLHLNKA